MGAVPEDVQVLQQGLKIHQMVRLQHSWFGFNWQRKVKVVWQHHQCLLQIDLRSEYERQHDLPLTNGLLSRAVYRKNSRRGLQIETEVCGKLVSTLKAGLENCKYLTNSNDGQLPAS